MTRSDIPLLTASELSRRIKAKEISPVEAVEAYLERIQKIDSKLHAYITVCGDEALAAARQAEREIARGQYRGPMHGIPVAVKDQWWTKGVRTTGGSTILKDFVPQEDATVMSKLKEAGGILIGKTNLTEFAMAYTYHFPFGTPRNPWNLKHMPGGSSAGSGSAVAASLCAAALGEDTGGSIRGPASYCGIVGLRPSQGRVSRHGLLGACWSMDTIGPMTQTVRDCAMTLQVIAGYDPKDPYTWDVPVPDYRRSLNGNIKGLKVGLLKERVYADHVDPEVREAVLRATEVMRELGASVQDVSLPMVLYDRAITQAIAMVEGAAAHHGYIRERINEYDHNMRIHLLAASLIPAQTYYKAQKIRAVCRAEFSRLMEDVDVLVYPTAATPAPLIIDKPGFGTKEEIKRELLYTRRTLTSLANVVGAPALSIPCGFSSTKLPLGLQIVGRPMEEGRVLRLGDVYERATNWHDSRPSI